MAQQIKLVFLNFNVLYLFLEINPQQGAKVLGIVNYQYLHDQRLINLICLPDQTGGCVKLRTWYNLACKLYFLCEIAGIAQW